MSWQSSRNSVMRMAPRALLSTMALAGLIAGPVFAGEPCNPIIDGTYCATQMPKNRGSSGASGGMKPLDDYSRLVPSAAVGGTPWTLIGIGVQGNRSCFGLLRRAACD